MARDSKGLMEAKLHQVEDCDPIAEVQKVAVRNVLCGNALDAAEALDFMMMLGVHPSQNDEDSPRLNVRAMHS